MEIRLSRKHFRLSYVEVAVAGWLALLVYVASIAWVSEDAYITFRVIDNFINGYGLRWNIGERVQAYTHPLWMLLHIPIYYVWHNLFLISCVLSITCTMAAAAVVLITAPRSPLHVLCFFFFPFIASKSVMDYTGSGLENPLSYLLFAVFGYVILKQNQHKHFWFYCSFTVALAMLNRLDVVILYAPVLLYLVASRFRSINWPQVLLGALPLISWFYFSLLYYGFLFPNTKYAKLNTGWPLGLYFNQGIYYAKHLLIIDLPGLLILLSSLLFLMRRLLTNVPIQLPQLPAAIAGGIGAYCLYIIYVGGDYMAGRFWSLPIFVAIWTWCMFFPFKRRDFAFAMLCTLAVTYAIMPLLQDIRQSCTECIALQRKVMNARFVFSRNHLVADFYPLRIRHQGQYPFADKGRQIAKEVRPVKVVYYIGMSGFYAGHKHTIVDMLALADPLLARLPVSTQQQFYIGHFRRAIPDGYAYALETGSLSRMEPALAKYYEKLRLITAGDIFDPERLKTILFFNLGYYDNWRQQYIANHPA